MASPDSSSGGNLSLDAFKVCWKVNRWDKADLNIKQAKQDYRTDRNVHFFVRFNKILRDGIASTSDPVVAKIAGSFNDSYSALAEATQAKEEVQSFSSR